MTVAFIDSETLCPLDIKTAGSAKYARHPEADAFGWYWAFDAEHVQRWSPPWCHPDPQQISGERGPLQRLLDHVEAGGIVIAWNVYFDWLIWNLVMVPKYGWPPLKIEQCLDAQAQAEGSLLPGGLDAACKALNTKHKKNNRGKKLISLLCTDTRTGVMAKMQGTHPAQAVGDAPDPAAYLALLREFRDYGGDDIPSMRDVWNKTRPLSVEEWREYWAHFAINDRGKYVDVEFAAAASKFASVEKARISERLVDLSGDSKMTIGAHTRKARWMFDALAPAPELQMLVQVFDKDGRPAEDKKGNPKFCFDKSVRASVLAGLAEPEHAELFEQDAFDTVLEFAESVEAGNSAAATKYPKVVSFACDDQRLRGGYVFNGGGPGRFSSRGVQEHNLTRTPITKPIHGDGKPHYDPNYAMDFIEYVVWLGKQKSADYEHHAKVLEAEYGAPITRLLGRALRPTIQAPPGKLLAWCDWSSIEARKLPWLAKSNSAELKLDVFRRFDAGEGPDVYRVAAGGINHIPPEAVTDKQRQEGKVLELSLGFGGGHRALRNMAKNYGVFLTEERAKDLVQSWRKNNDWATSFWYALKDAAASAMCHEKTWFPVGRVSYAFFPELMNGSLVCVLPSGRPLVYPNARYVPILNEHTGKVRNELTYKRAWGQSYIRVKLWHGILAENVTQASAACLLRAKLVELEDVAVAHTHDEIVVEGPEDGIEPLRDRVYSTMITLPKWAEGLPIAAEANYGPFYAK